MMGAGQPFGLLEEFASNRSDPSFGERVGYWCADHVLSILNPSVRKTWSKEAVNWLPRSRTRARRHFPVTTGRQHRYAVTEPGQGSLEREHVVLHSSGGVEAVWTDESDASDDAARPFVVGGVDHSMTAVRARSPSPIGRLFASASVPWRATSSSVIRVRRLPNNRSASGSRKLRLAPRST